MKFLFRLLKISPNYLSLLESILLLLSVMLIVPYFILCYYNNPSIDDFSFAIKTLDIGYWQAQVSAYTTWNGRYFASFVLCAHPMVFDSHLLYKIESVILLCLTIHSCYYFIRNCFELKSNVISFALAIVIAFCYLDKMPTLVQGIYWASGAMTYHLANTLFLYLATNIYLLVFKPQSETGYKKITCALLIIACCGSNESIMLITILLISSVLAYFLIIKRTINKLFLLYLFISLVCFVILLSSPGGVIREKDFVDPNTKNVLFTLISSFKAGNNLISVWLFSKQTLVLSLFLIFCFLKWGTFFLKTKESILYFLLITIGGYLLITSTFSPGFWATARIAPDRAINCSLWLFFILWSVALFFIASFLASAFSSLNKLNYSPLLLLCFAGLLITIKSSGNYYNACNDIITGKAYIYNNECKKRVAIMKSADDKTICELPAFSVYPKSVFNEDLVEDDFNWWNREFAKYYHKMGVRVVRKASGSSQRYLLTFDDEASKGLSNGATITNESSFSAPNCSALNGADTYSASFAKLVSEMDIHNSTAVSTVTVSAVINSQEALIDAVLVFCSTDPAGKSLFWYGKEIVQPNYPVNTWRKEGFTIPITQSSMMESQNKLSVYLWNRGKGKIYLDDLFVELY